MTGAVLKPNMQAATGRIRFLDAAKGIGILIIAWGHLDYLWSPASVWFSSFKLAIFYIVSGLLSGQRQQESWTTVAKKRIFSLIIPYVVYSVLAVLFHLQYSANTWAAALKIIKDDFLLTATLRGISTLWFLPSLYLGEVLFAAVNFPNCTKKMRISIFLLLPLLLWAASDLFVRLQPVFTGSALNRCLGYLFLTLSRSVVAFWFIGIGHLLRNHFLHEKPAKLWVVLCAIGVNVGLSLLNTDVDLNHLCFGKYPLLFFPNGILGSFALLETLRLLEKHCKLTVSSYCGRHALFIMATHLPWYISTRIHVWSMRIAPFENLSLGYYAVTLLCFVAMMLLEWLLISIKQLSKGILLRHTGKYRFGETIFKYL